MVDKVVSLSLGRFLEVLPSENDIELVVLKCHLLIEEVLVKVIKKGVEHPKYLTDARLSFAQKIHVARCVSRDDIAPWVWGALSKLNIARNEIGHGLSGSKIDTKVDCFVEYVDQHEKVLTSLGPSGKFTLFHYAALTVYSALSFQANLRVSDILFGPHSEDAASR